MGLNQVYRCSVCGGELSWDPTAQLMKCPYCDETFTMEQMQEQGKTELNEENYERGQSAEELGYTESTDDTAVDPKDLKVYKCRHCAAEIITDKNTAATTCVYCGNPVVIEEQLVNGFTPKWVIPFKIKQEDVREKYLSFIKKRFTPDSFMTDTHIQKIKGVYIPFWLYDAKVSGIMSYDAEKTSRRTTSDYIITTHKVYDVDRAGNISYKRIPADASSKTDNKVMDSVEPFDYSDLTKFEMPYLAGYFAEKYDEDAKTCEERIIPRIKQTFKDKVEKTVSDYNTKKITREHINHEITNSDYAMLPVYLLYTKYNEKDYIFAMNGQTGKMIGNIPLDKGKVLKFWLGWSALLSVLSTIVYLFII